MFSELREEIAGAFNQLRHGTETTTLTVAKPYCAPCRNIITATFQQYGVKMYGYSEVVRTVSPVAAWRSFRQRESMLEGISRLDPLPVAHVASVTVSAKAASWAEYLLLRTGKLYVPGRYQDKRNQQWAEKHGGRMPPQWNESPWIETSCSEGMSAWQPLRDAMQEQRDGQAPNDNRRTSARKRRM